MKLYVYCLFDKAQQRFLSPVITKDEARAMVRQLSHQVKCGSPDDPLRFAPADFSFWELGYFDDANGHFEQGQDFDGMIRLVGCDEIADMNKMEG